MDIAEIKRMFPGYTEKQVLKLAMMKDMLHFVKICLPESMKNDTPDFHLEIIKHIQDENVKKLNILSFRGSAKSTIASYFLPMWKVCTASGKGDSPYILIVSESQGQAKNFLDRIKSDLNDNPKIKYYFGDLGERTAKRWQSDDIILANGSRIKAMGTGQKPRGVITKHTRPSMIILDDIESESNGSTPEARHDNRLWITNAIEPCLTPDGKTVMIGTVIADDCLMMVAKASSQWTTLEYAILTEEGKPIWEDRYDMKWIEAKKAYFAEMMNASGFYQEYMNQPQSPEDAPFKQEFFQYHDMELVKKEGKNYLQGKGSSELIPCYVTAGVDLASSLNVKADFTVFITMAHTLGNKHYVIDVTRFKADPAYHPDRFVDYFLKYRHDCVAIESIAYQDTMRMSVRRICEEKGIYIPGLEVGLKQRSSKSERILSLVPIIANKRFFIKASMIVYLREFLSYPRGAHDDQIDATWNSMTKARKPWHKEYKSDQVAEPMKKKHLDWMTI